MVKLDLAEKRKMLGVDGRWNNFDFLRLFMALSVVFSHSFAIAPNHHLRDPLSWASQGQMDVGIFAVMSFFIISGFLITQSWVKCKGLGDFLLRRVKRIYPGYIVTIMVCALVVAPLAMEHYRDAWSYRNLRNAVLSALSINKYIIQDAFPTTPIKGEINGSLWSVHYEFLCYFLLAGVGLLGLFKKRFLIAILYLLAVGFHAWVDIQKIPLEYSWFSGGINRSLTMILGAPFAWPECAATFLAGAFFYIYREQIPHRTWLALLCGGLMVAGLFVPQSMGRLMETCGAYLIFWFAFHPGIRLYHFGKHGDFSYGVYLYAYPIQQLMAYWWGSWINPWSMMALALPASLLAGFISWHVVEKRFLPNRVARMAAEEKPPQRSPTEALVTAK